MQKQWDRNVVEQKEMNPILSILIPSIPERLIEATTLYFDVQRILHEYEVEILMLCDNKKMSIGAKRDKLKNMATGDYFAFVDDDDKIAENYFFIAQAIKQHPDIITFKQKAIINEQSCIIDFDLTHEENEGFEPDKEVRRKPFHVCAWKRKLVQDISFKSLNYGEDWYWCEQALKRIETQVKIDEVLHTYIFNSEKSAAEN